MRKLCLVLASMMLIFTQQADAQGFLKKIGDQVKKSANQAVQQAERQNASANQNANTSFVKADAAKAAEVSGPKANAPKLYVSQVNGSNRNDGSKDAPYKNLQKAIDNASAGSVIYVAEGNYYGLLNSGNINIDKPLTIYGGYNSDFSERDILKYKSMVQPTPESNGTASGQGTLKITSIVAPSEQLLIDGLIFDRGNSISYNVKGEGKPEGVYSSMMNPVGVKGIGGPELKTPDVLTTETALIYFNGHQGVVNNLNVVIRNCAFINGPNFGILGMLKGSLLVENCIFINIRMSAIEVRGANPNVMTQVTARNNTILFMWTRTREFTDMGYGYRMLPGTSNTLENNIIGLTLYTGLDRSHVDSDKSKEALRKDVVRNNIFFLNKKGDLGLPGGGMGMNVKVELFDDVEQLADVGGNKALTDPSLFKGKINLPYLDGFLSASYKETSSFDPNSPANTFRSAMGMNLTGTIQSSVSMFANRYPWEEALLFFGAVEGYGAQMPQ